MEINILQTIDMRNEFMIHKKICYAVHIHNKAIKLVSIRNNTYGTNVITFSLFLKILQIFSIQFRRIVLVYNSVLRDLLEYQSFPSKSFPVS